MLKIVCFKLIYLIKPNSETEEWPKKINSLAPYNASDQLDFLYSLFHIYSWDGVC